MSGLIKRVEPWEHESGYHLKGDGHQLKYRHPETGWLAILQVSGYKYLVTIHNSTGSIEFWDYRQGKEAAKELLKEKMEEHA